VERQRRGQAEELVRKAAPRFRGHLGEAARDRHHGYALRRRRRRRRRLRRRLRRLRRRRRRRRRKKKRFKVMSTQSVGRG